MTHEVLDRGVAEKLNDTFNNRDRHVSNTSFNLTYKDGPPPERIKIFLLAVDP